MNNESALKDGTPDASDEERVEEAQAFFRALYGDSISGWLCLNPRPSGYPQWFSSTDCGSAARAAVELCGGNNVYFGVGLRAVRLDDNSNSRKTGDASTVRVVPGIWAEVDWQSDAHAETQLPRSPAEANELLAQMPLRASIIVSSGHGYHAYWLFDQPMVLETESDRLQIESLLKDWESLLRSKAEKRGWKIDNVARLAQVMRVPGTFNLKKGRRTPVRIRHINVSEHARYPVDLIRSVLPTQERSSSANSKRSAAQREASPDLDQIEAGCGWLRHCRADAASLPEPEWYAMLSIVGRCAAGPLKAHEWSAPYPNYSYQECERKLKDAVSEKSGPRTCDNIRRYCGGEKFCRACPVSGKIKSPIVLGMPQGQTPSARYVWVVELERFLDLDTMTYLTKTQLNDALAHRTRRVSERLLGSHALRKVDKPTYAPGCDRFVDEFDGSATKTCVNLWRDTGVRPAPGDIEPFLQHLSHLVPVESEREHILSWLACLVQRPCSKIKHSVLIQGGQGIGKSFLGDVLELVLGESNCRSVEPEEISGEWGGWLVNAQLVVVHEMRSGDAVGAYDKLKALITQKRVRINEKGIPPHELVNRANFLMFTNHEDAVRLEKDDRRFFVTFSPMERKNPEYYKRLFDWLADGGAKGVRHYLETRDIHDFDADAPPPETEHKRVMMEESRTEIERTLFSLFERQAFPLKHDLVSILDIVRHTECKPSPTHRTVAKWLRNINALHVGQIRIPGEGRISLWAIRNQWFYAEMLRKSAAEVATAYQKQRHAPDAGEASVSVF